MGHLIKCLMSNHEACEECLTGTHATCGRMLHGTHGTCKECHMVFNEHLIKYRYTYDMLTTSSKSLAVCEICVAMYHGTHVACE